MGKSAQDVTSYPPPPQILANQPLQARNATTPEDLDDSDFESHNGERVLTPTSSHYQGSEMNDLPPSYEEAQAQATRETGHTTQRADSNLSPNPNDLQVNRLVLVPNASQISIDSGASSRISTPAPTPTSAQIRRLETDERQPNPFPDSTNALLESLLAFTRNAPSGNIDYAPPLTRRVAIPPAIEAGSAQFARAYSQKLQAHSISPEEFLAFIDGLNALLASAPTKMEAQQALLAIADPVGEGNTPAADGIRRYLTQANGQFFALRGVEAQLQTLPQLVHSLPVTPGPGERQEVQKLRKAVFKSSTAKQAGTALEPYVEALTWAAQTPAPSGEQVFRVDTPQQARDPEKQQFGTTGASDVPGNRDTIFSDSSLPSYHSTLDHTTSAPMPPPPQHPAQPDRSQSWAAWGQNFGRQMGQWGQDYGKSMGQWGQDYGKRVGRWGEDYGRQWGSMGEDIGRSVERRVTGDSSWDREEREELARNMARDGWTADSAGAEAQSDRHGRCGRRSRRQGPLGGRSRLLGPNGILGPNGPLGVNGPLGPNGPLGHNGPLGINGPLGPNGPLGRNSPFIGGLRGAPATAGSPYGGPSSSTPNLQREETEQDVDAPHGSRRHGRRGRHGRHERKANTPTAAAEDSDSESDDSDSSSDSEAEEAEAEHFEAQREYLKRVQSIERKAREDTVSLGEKARAQDVVKIEQRREADLARAQQDKHKADAKFSVKQFKRERRRAYRQMKRQCRQDRRRLKHNRGEGGMSRQEVKAARSEYREKIKKSRDEYREAVRAYSEEMRNGRKDRTLDQVETVSGLSTGKSKSGWMVWLVIKDLEEAAY